MDESGQLHKPVVLRPGNDPTVSIKQERSRAGLDAFPLPGIGSRSYVPLPVHYADWAIPISFPQLDSLLK
jgi:hypothetical protein